MKINLNNLQIPGDCGGICLEDNSIKTNDIEVVFRNHKEKIIKLCENNNFAIGCVAWLTDHEILEALSKINTCIVVQKEDFLRPDYNYDKNKLQKLYDKIKWHCYTDHFHWKYLPSLSYCGCIDGGIRCMGNYNRDKKPAFPRMHNKFMIFGTERKTTTMEEYMSEDEVFKLNSVWTGSFNFTYNAGYSLENAVIISNKEIITAYINEFCQIYSLSEDLDWSCDWCDPEYRIGS